MSSGSRSGLQDGEPKAGSSIDRFAVVVCDGMGCGEAPDADRFGDEGANTLGHVIETRRPELPRLARLGLDRIPGVPSLGAGFTDPAAAWGRMVERCPSKDTMLGHWELMGRIAERPFPTYPEGFPGGLIDAFRRLTGRGVLGNRPASGTAIVEELGRQHLETGDLIVYTSADSVFQVAAHGDVVPVDELWEICGRARREILVGDHAVGRVIARPFRGGPESGFERLDASRRDFPLPPTGPTVLDCLSDEGIPVCGIGKVQDIFAGRGLSSSRKTADNDEGVRAIVEAISSREFGLVFANLVDFDTRYGHRNDPEGYAAALEAFDARIPELLDVLELGDALVITADHGTDPTWPGTDHTRECVPLLVAGRGIAAIDLGTRSTFADLGATILEAMVGDDGLDGTSFLAELQGPGR